MISDDDIDALCEASSPSDRRKAGIVVAFVWLSQRESKRSHLRRVLTFIVIQALSLPRLEAV